MVNRRRKVNLKLWPVLVLLLLLFIAGYIFYTLTVKSKWKGKNRFTLAVQVNSPQAANTLQTAIFSIETSTQQAILINLPEELMIEVPFGYKSYPLKSVYRLGELDAKRGGGLLLTKSLENTFGISIDAYYVTYSDTFSVLVHNEDEFQSIKRKYFSLSSLIKFFIKFLETTRNTDTDLTAADIYRLFISIRDLRANQIKLIDLEQASWLTGEQLPDGNLVKILDNDIFDNMFVDSFYDSRIRIENLTLEVVNATEQEKVAAYFSRIIRHLGGNVIIKTTARQPEKKACTIITSNKNQVKSNLLRLLIHKYSCTITSVSKWDSQADIKIILGKDFIK